MTYTYKLARRLAISRRFAMVTLMLLLAACAGDDATGPDATPTTITNPYSLRVIPGAATIETGQQIRFRGQGASGDVFVSRISWESSGGRIDADGTFSASEPGTYKIVGRGRGRQRPDTSVVVVVPPQPGLTALEVSPEAATVAAGASRAYAVVGRFTDGTTTAVGVVWTATGGTIDAGGVYTAGAEAGTYRVIATQVSGTLSDTAQVEVTGSPEEPTPPPPPAPTLAQVVITPASVSLATNGTRQFAAYGRNSLGDSVAVSVTFRATGGTITSGGLYTAGTTGGSYRVIATASGVADTASVTLTRISGSGTVGIPFGPSQQLDRAGGVNAPFTMTSDPYAASNLISRIDAARAGKYKLLLAMTGGKHENYMSYIGGVHQFDEAKWRAKMDTYNTPAIREAVAAAVRDGVIIGANVMDEPHVTGGGDGNTWGPPGTMTKARVDGLCGYVRQIFPSLPVGVFHQHNVFEPEKSYRVCDFIIDQYNHRRGDVAKFRDDGLALARRDGHEIMFSLNILNGGVQDKDGVWDCTGAGQGGKGTYAPNCRMTPTQVWEWGQVLGPAGCALFMWRYDATFAANPENMQAFKDLGARLATLPSRPCRRS